MAIDLSTIDPVETIATILAHREAKEQAVQAHKIVTKTKEQVQRDAAIEQYTALQVFAPILIANGTWQTLCDWMWQYHDKNQGVVWMDITPSIFVRRYFRTVTWPDIVTNGMQLKHLWKFYSSNLSTWRFCRGWGVFAIGAFATFMADIFGPSAFAPILHGGGFSQAPGKPEVIYQGAFDPKEVLQYHSAIHQWHLIASIAFGLLIAQMAVTWYTRCGSRGKVFDYIPEQLPTAVIEWFNQGLSNKLETQLKEIRQ